MPKTYVRNVCCVLKVVHILGHRVVVSVGAPCIEALALNVVVVSLSPVLSDLCCMSIPASLSPLCAIPLQIKATKAKKP